MALEIENGYPVLTLDIGNGQERILNSKFVADGNWYQFIIERLDGVYSITHAFSSYDLLFNIFAGPA